MAITEERDTERTPLERYGRMLLIRAVRERDPPAVPEGRGARDDAPLRRAGGGRGRRDCWALGEGDWIAGTYRGHGHCLAAGTEPEALVAEMLGRATGVCGGRAGSMNVIDLAHGMVGCFGIVGGSIGAATGAALSAKRTGNVAVAFFGDGATNGGYFHECLNFAAAAALPAVFVCENNLVRRVHADAARSPPARTSRAARRAYDMPGAVVDGNDLWAVAEATQAAVERARGGGGPTLLEMRTYRHYGHSKSDPATYRPEGELEAWLERDPLKLTRARLLESGRQRGGDRATEEASRRASSTAPWRPRWPRRTRSPTSTRRREFAP